MLYLQVIEMLQAEVAEKDTMSRSLLEQLDLTKQQLASLQESFVTMETSWKEKVAALQDEVAIKEQVSKSSLSICLKICVFEKLVILDSINCVTIWSFRGIFYKVMYLLM